MALLQQMMSPITYRASNPAGPWLGLFLTLTLAIVYMVAQALFAVLIAATVLGAAVDDQRAIVKGAIIATLPAALVAAALGVAFAKVRGGRARDVIALKDPGLSAWQWSGLVAMFLAGMWAFVILVGLVLQIDPAQYTPGPDGSSPSTGSAGLVKEAMYGLVREPRLFAMALASVAIGAPLAEEIIFRGQFFALLTQSRLGRTGAVLLSSALWALLHATEPRLTIALIFVMGLVLGCVLLRFGSLWVTMVMHGAWNAVYSLFIFSTLQP
jgi:uncharacterized protein